MGCWGHVKDKSCSSVTSVCSSCPSALTLAISPCPDHHRPAHVSGLGLLGVMSNRDQGWQTGFISCQPQLIGRGILEGGGGDSGAEEKVLSVLHSRCALAACCVLRLSLLLQGTEHTRAFVCFLPLSLIQYSLALTLCQIGKTPTGRPPRCSRSGVCCDKGLVEGHSELWKPLSAWGAWAGFRDARPSADLQV